MTKKLILFALAIFLLSIVNAFPIQLMPNGSLMEMNESMNVSDINGTLVDIVLVNNSIYIIPANRSIINTTNITYVNATYLNTTSYDYRNITTTYNVTNVTCNNCSYGNYTYYINGSVNVYGKADVYNRTEIDGFFSAVNSWRGQIDTNLPNYALKSEINSSTSTSKEWKSTEKIFMWILIVISLIIGLFAIYLIYFAGAQ